MAKKATRTRLRNTSPTRESQACAAVGQFPPISTSLPNFVRGGSDREFRELLYALIRLSTLMVQNRQCFAAYVGLTDPQYTMLALIAENSDATVSKLAEKLSVSTQFVTVEIGKMIKDNIVDKRPNERDRRSMILGLTEKGKGLLRELGPLRCRTNDLMFESLTEERGRALKQIVDKLIADGTRALHELKAPHHRREKAS